MLKGNKVKAVEMLISGDYMLEEIAEELKITPRTLYNWRQEDEFSAELDRRMKIKIGGIAPRALRRMEELLDARSEMVSHLAAKDLLDRAGFAADNNINLSVDPVQIVNDIPRSGGDG